MMKTSFVFALLLFLACLQNPSFVEEPNPEIQAFINVFEAYEEYCPYFAHKEIDWKVIGDEFYSPAAESGSQEALFDVIVEMLGELEDPAIVIYELDEEFVPIDSVFPYTKEYEPNFDMDVLVENYMEPNGWAGWNDGYTEGFGWCDPEILPYAFLDIIPSEQTPEGLNSLDAFVAECIELDLPAIIVDIRMNPPGTASGHEFMGRFTDKSRPGAIYRSRSGPEYYQYIDQRPAVYEAGPEQYTGTVILLLGEGCIQTSEDMAANFRNFPNVVLVGGTTGGSVSLLSTSAYLFGDWYCMVVSKTILTYEKHWIEGAGIAPDIYVQSTEADFSAGVDPVMDYAMETLEEFAR